MLRFRCKDTELWTECAFEVQGASSEGEVTRIAAIHAKEAHGVNQITPEKASKISAAIR